MPPRDAPFGSDTLPTACCLATGYDDPAFIDWRRDHPDWFVAGTWTSTGSSGPNRPAPAGHPTGDQAGSRSRGIVGTGGHPRPALDPETISLSDFRDVVARAKEGSTIAGSQAYRKRPAGVTPSPDPPSPDAPA